MITKRFLPIVILGMLLISCSNEPKNPAEQKTPLPDSIMVYNISTDKSVTLSQITYYTYDEVGNMIRQLDIDILGDGERAPDYKKEMKYDSKQHPIEQREALYRTQNGIWRYIACWRWTYNEDGKLETIAGYDNAGDSIAEQPSQKGTYTWLDNTHAECLIYRTSGESTWYMAEKKEVIYNDHGDIEKECHYSYTNESWKLWMTFEQTYDEHNNVVSYIWQERGTTILQKFYKYEYDETGKILVVWYSQSFSDSVPDTPASKCVYCY